jgi:hypothetical protein
MNTFEFFVGDALGFFDILEFEFDDPTKKSRVILNLLELSQTLEINLLVEFAINGLVLSDVVIYQHIFGRSNFDSLLFRQTLALDISIKNISMESELNLVDGVSVSKTNDVDFYGVPIPNFTPQTPVTLEWPT